MEINAREKAEPEDGERLSKRTAVLQGVDRSVLVRPLQMVIPLEFDQVE